MSAAMEHPHLLRNAESTLLSIAAQACREGRNAIMALGVVPAAYIALLMIAIGLTLVENTLTSRLDRNFGNALFVISQLTVAVLRPIAFAVFFAFFARHLLSLAALDDRTPARRADARRRLLIASSAALVLTSFGVREQGIVVNLLGLQHGGARGALRFAPYDVWAMVEIVRSAAWVVLLLCAGSVYGTTARRLAGSRLRLTAGLVRWCGWFYGALAFGAIGCVQFARSSFSNDTLWQLVRTPRTLRTLTLLLLLWAGVSIVMGIVRERRERKNAPPETSAPMGNT